MNDLIAEYWFEYCKENKMEQPVPNAWMFGDGSVDMANELGQLVAQGKKTATCSAYILYELEKEPLPEEGQYDIVLDGRNKPLAIIQNTGVELKKMKEVTSEFSRLEGEGDLSHEYWYNVHQLFFTELLADIGKNFSDDMLLVCETFKVVSKYTEH
ncbi:MAG: ASCH domain-containing protein [Kurthia sp.]|nr:ASCH domain-containing protein [Candidatus Kurthia equi]